MVTVSRMLPRPAYRSVLLGASFLQLAVAYTAWYSFTVFLVALVDEFGWSHAETALAQSLLIVISGLGGPGWCCAAECKKRGISIFCMGSSEA
jgi:hypothetical protein